MNQAITLSTCAFGSGEHDSSYYARQFERAMKAGFDGFELTLYSDNDVPQILEAVHLSGAPIIAVHGVGKGNWFADTPEEQKKAAVESARYLEHFAEFAPCMHWGINAAAILAIPRAASRIAQIALYLTDGKTMTI